MKETGYTFFFKKVDDPLKLFATIKQIVFNNCKSCKLLNSILKNQTENPIKVSQSASQEIQTSNSLKNGKILDVRQRARQINNLSVHTDKL